MRVFLLICLFASAIAAQTMPAIEPGVSQDLAKWRASQYSNISYKLNLTIEKMSPVLRGSMEIHVTQAAYACAEPNCPPMAIILDCRKIPGHEKDSTISNVTINGKSAVSLWSRMTIEIRGMNPDKTPEPLSPTPTPNGDVTYDERDDHLIFRDGVKMGENVIKLDFTSPILTSGSAITRYIDKEDGSEYIYSLFVPSDASTAFPVFDQPDLKAKFTLNLDIPNDWDAIGNSQFLASSTFYFPQEKDRRHSHRFFETKPISTYVFAFAAGPFESFGDAQSGTNYISTSDRERYKKWADNNVVSISAAGEQKFQESTYEKSPPKQDFTTLYVRKSQAAKFKPHAAEVFQLNREAVKYLETYFDYKFPFPKYDLVLIPEFPFGGMEHAGATFLREQSVIFPQEPTKNDIISRANLIFHEAAHQWFGDTVTMKWFDDLWLKEGFAEFMAYKTLEKVMPDANAWKVFYERNKQAAYATDSTKGTTPIYQPIANLNSAKSAYGNIVYRKAPSFLRQAEFYLGEDKFQTAVRAFLKKHEYANAGWEDLVDEFGSVSWQQFSGVYNVNTTFETNPDGSRTFTKSYEEPHKLSSKERAKAEEKGRKNLQEWASNWVNTRGLSIVRYREGTRYVVGGGLTVKQSNALDENRLSDLQFEVLVRNGSFDNILTLGLRRDEKQAELNIDTFLPMPNGRNGVRLEPVSPTSRFIFANYRDYDYGIFLLDDKSRDYVLKNILNEKDDFLRTMMWGSLWDSVREAELDPKDYVELVIKNIGLEKDEGTIQTLLSRVTTAMNYYTSSDAGLRTRLEDLLVDKIQNASTQGQRITYYRAFLNIASTDKSRGMLKQILKAGSGTAKSSNQMTLKTKDKFDIVTRLIILGDPEAPALLAALEKTETSDDARRYAYAAKAGIPTAENKAKFWNDFLNNKDISESWIESAIDRFNSIRHAELTQQYLTRSLAELPNLKRSRKIFFVNDWLEAFIGGQKSEEALAAINKFLSDNPNLDNDLRLKILENSDLMERAVKIRAKYSKN